MKLSEYRQTYYDFSAQASEVARYAAFAGIAVVWIFKVDSGPSPAIPQQLFMPTAFFALVLTLDLLQYTTATVIWHAFYRFHERKLTDPSTVDPEISHEWWLVLPLDLLFYTKLLAVVVGYLLVARFLWITWFWL